MLDVPERVFGCIPFAFPSEASNNADIIPEDAEMKPSFQFGGEEQKKIDVCVPHVAKDVPGRKSCGGLMEKAQERGKKKYGGNLEQLA